MARQQSYYTDLAVGKWRAIRCTAHGTVSFEEDLGRSYHFRSPIEWCPQCADAHRAEQDDYTERQARAAQGSAT
jgi:hypothetical protein